MKVLDATPSNIRPEIEPHDVLIQLDAEDLKTLFLVAKHPAFGAMNLTSTHVSSDATRLFNKLATSITDAVADASPK